MEYTLKQKSGIIYIYKYPNYTGFIRQDFSEYLENASWWVEVQSNGTPFTPSRKPFHDSFGHPPCAAVGPFHCAECADTAVNFGKTTQQAWEFVHGSDDEKFGAFLGRE